MQYYYYGIPWLMLRQHGYLECSLFTLGPGLVEGVGYNGEVVRMPVPVQDVELGGEPPGGVPKGLGHTPLKWLQKQSEGRGSVQCGYVTWLLSFCQLLILQVGES